MGKSHKKVKNGTGNQACALLAEAMKQPSVKSILDVFERTEKYVDQSAAFANYIDWQKFPTSSSACQTSQAA